jgi:hypothetical protein
MSLLPLPLPSPSSLPPSPTLLHHLIVVPSPPPPPPPPPPSPPPIMAGGGSPVRLGEVVAPAPPCTMVAAAREGREGGRDREGGRGEMREIVNKLCH